MSVLEFVWEMVISASNPGPCGCNGLTGAKNGETFPIQVVFKRSPFYL